MSGDRRVVHLIGSLDAGGAERRLLELMTARGISAQQHCFATLSGRRGSLAVDFEALGCRVEPCRLGPGFPARFAALLRGWGPDPIVHSHVQLASGYLLALAWLFGASRRIAHIRSTGDGRSSTPLRTLYRMAGRVLLRCFASEVVAVSRAALQGATKNWVPSDRCRVVYGQIDGTRFGPNQAPTIGPIRIAVLGRVDTDKNPSRALEVIAALQESGPIQAEFVGRVSEKDRQALSRSAKRLRIGESVTFVGESDDVPSVLARTHVLVSTSIREGLPGAVIEAVAAGVPAVVSDIDPHVEVSSILLGVIPVPLDAANDDWALVIRDAVDARASKMTPERLMRGFDNSPFSMTYGYEAWDELWGS